MNKNIKNTTPQIVTIGRFRITATLLLLLFTSNLLLSQQYYFHNYTGEHGLSQLTGQALFQDQDGYIWIGTQAGLNRYDGNVFEIFSVSDGLVNDWINAIQQDKSGAIWVASNGGLSRWDAKAFVNFNQENGLPSRYINDLAIDQNNRVWCATRNGLSCWNGVGFKNITREQGLPKAQINSLYINKLNQFWVASDSGLYYRANNNFLPFNHSAIKNQPVTKVTQDLQHRLWIGTSEGIYCFANSILVAQFGADDGIDGWPVTAIIVDQKGVVWAGTQSQLLKFENNTCEIIAKENGLPFYGVRALLEDREGIIWVSSFGGVAKFLGRAFTNYKSSDGLGSSFVRPITGDKNGTIWVGTREGLSAFDGRSWSNFIAKDGLPGNNVESLLYDSNDTLWIGTSAGLCYKKISLLKTTAAKQSEKLNFTEIPVTKNFGRIVYLAEDSTNTKWLSVANKGVFTLKTSSLRKIEVPGQHFTNARMLVDHFGVVWLTGDQGLSCWNGKTWQTYTTKNGLADNEPYFIVEDKRGKIWFGYHSSRGITCFDRSEFTTFTTKGGLFNDAVYSIGVDQKNNIWIGTSRGLDRFDGNSFTNYSTSDGYVHQESNAGSFFAAKDGTLWFGTADGVSRYNSRYDFNLNKIQPQAKIHKIKIGDQAVNIDTTLTLAHSHNPILIQIAPLSFINPKHLAFRYKLSGLDNEWHTLNGYEINYPFLEPGEYSLEVQGRKFFQNWSKSVSMKFTVKPPYWQAWWFILLCIFTGAWLIALVAHLRTQKLKNQQLQLEQLVNERTAQLKQQKEKAERFVALVENSLDFIAIATLQGHVIYVNKYGRELVGLGPDEELNNKHATEFNSEEASENLGKTVFPTVLKTGQWTGSSQLKHFKTSELIDVYKTVFTVNDLETGKPLYLATVQKDIRDLIVVQQEIVRERNLLQTFMDNIPDNIYFKDTHCRFVKINQAMAKWIGLQNPEEAVGKTDSDIFSSEHAIQAYKDEQEIIKSGKPMTNLVEKETWSDKKDTWVSTTKVPLHDANGKCIGLIGISRDVTKQIEAQEELKKAKAAAESANQSKSDFLANMSHEIRTPLNAIIGMTDLTLETQLTVEQRQNLSVVQSSSESLLSLINDILDFSKIEAGQMELEAIDFNLRELIESISDIFAVKAAAKNLELLCYIDPKLPDNYVGDPTRLRQVLINLVGNAIKFTSAGEVTLKVISRTEKETSDNKVEFHFIISDTGIGIPKEKQKRIFDKFNQADNSTTRKFGGTGLGLSISKSLVELMEGKIWLESAPGSGTTFNFTIKSGISEPKETRQYAYQYLAGLTALIVDDNASNLQILQDSLQAWGLKIVTASSGPQALSILGASNQHFDLLVIDYQMPEMDGITTIELIRNKLKLDHLKIIVLSSWKGLKPETRRDFNITRALTKPVKQSSLFNALIETFRQTKPEINIIIDEIETNQPLRKNLNILLVEDNPDNQKLAKTILTGAGYNVEIADNGAIAVEAFQKNHFDLVLMDIQMPVKDGFTTTTEIRTLEKAEKFEHIPIVALTAHAIQGYHEKCLQHGMDDYITKPIKKKVLLETVNKWIDQRHAIMVVDDSIDNQVLLKNYLKQLANYKVIFAKNGREAFEIVDKRQNISLIFIDMEMPEMSGYDSVKLIRTLVHTKSLPIIGMSAHYGPEAPQKCLDSGCTDFLQKPIRKHELFKMVESSIV